MTPLARASGALTLAWFAAVIIAAVIGQNAALGAFYRVVAIVFVLGMWAEIILGMRRRTLDPELISWSRIMGYLFVLPVNVGAALSPLPWAVWVWAGLLGVMCVVPLKRITRKRGGPVVDPPVRRLPRTRSRGDCAACGGGAGVLSVLRHRRRILHRPLPDPRDCLLYTSDAADE